ncbi:MAG TPA: alpha/beta hydrolase [Polyangia bacterium]|nr:alpha/beta hydrolase [Polyangia bacterium]
MLEAPRWFRDAVALRPESCQIEVEGCPVHYLRWGDVGRPGLVFVHGGAAHAHWWSFIAPLFTSEYRVAAIDLSGHGESGRRDAYPRETWAREVLAVADDAHFDGPPIVVGHSMGGFVTIAAAAEYGERLAGAVVLDSPVRAPDPEAIEADRGKSFRNPKVYPDVDAALAKFRTVPDQPTSLPFILDHIARLSLTPVADGVTWKFDPAIFRRETPRASSEMLPRVKCRIALFRAENGLVTQDIGEYMYELLGRRAPVIEIPEAYHHIMLDQPLSLVTGLRTLFADWEHSIPRSRRR